MSLPYFPYYVAAYEAATAHMSLEEDGAYVRLLRLCWRSPGCSIPADAGWICKRMRVTPRKFEAVIRPLIAEFFTAKAGRIYSERLLEEWQKADVAYSKRVSAGSKGGKAKAAKSLAKHSSNALAMLKQSESESETETETEEVRKKDPSQEVETLGVGDTREALRVIGGRDA